MAPLVRILADAPGQADQWGVACADVPDAELGHGQVEHRVPLASGQGGRRYEQWEADHEHGDG